MNRRRFLATPVAGAAILQQSAESLYAQAASIQVAIDAAKSSITISARPIDGFIEIIITDDGTGIRKEHLSKVFDPFFTTKKGGTGLGLPICRKIIEDHEGSINIASSEEKGTTVTLLLKA